METNFDRKMLEITEIIASMSKCVKTHVGAIIVKDKRIISTGYNGTPIGYINCCDHFSGSSFDLKEHREWSEKNEIHAELNAILFAAKNGVNIDNSTIYINLSPCFNCCKNIAQSGIKRVVFNNIYDGSDLTEVMSFLEANNIEVQYIKC